MQVPGVPASAASRSNRKPKKKLVYDEPTFKTFEAHNLIFAAAATTAAALASSAVGASASTAAGAIAGAISARARRRLNDWDLDDLL